MFSFKKDKTGFFSALSLIIVASATVIATGILLAQGIREGNWEYYSVPIKIVLAVSWIVCMTIVLVRIGVFAVQRGNKKIQELQSAEKNEQQTETHNPGSESK